MACFDRLTNKKLTAIPPLSIFVKKWVSDNFSDTTRSGNFESSPNVAHR